MFGLLPSVSAPVASVVDRCGLAAMPPSATVTAPAIEPLPASVALFATPTAVLPSAPLTGEVPAATLVAPV